MPTCEELVGRGVRHERRREWEQAVDAYRAALAQSPSRADVWNLLGLVLYRTGDWLGAAQSYRMVVTLSRADAVTYYRLGRALERCGAWGEAREAFVRSEAVTPPEPSLDGIAGRQLSYRRRIDHSLMRRPQYAYSMYRAATLALRLGIPRVGVVEFGVAGGTGLLWMERHALDIEAMTGVQIDVYGLDTGEGLVAPQDERDLPYLFAEGNYSMDVDELQGRLTRARLVLGDAQQTFPALLETLYAPIGALAFDMDLYAPTRGVLDSMGDGAVEEAFLPRVPVYFDDVVGRGEQDYNEFTGELLAVREFNAVTERTKLVCDRRFRTLPLNFAWHHGMFMLHRFAHPDYGRYVSEAGPDSLSLDGRSA